MEISSLSQRVQDLEASVRFWNELNSWLVAGTAVLAIGLFLSQYVALKFGRQLAGAQAELLRLKDEQLKSDLKSKDIGIEEAIKDAAIANSHAEVLKQQNLATEKRLEAERLARIEIEERVASRRIPEKKRAEIARRLTPFAGQTVSTWSHAGDREGAVFASDISAILEAAHWDVYAPASKMDFAAAGRRGRTAIPTGVIVASSSHDTSVKASNALIRELLALGFDAIKSPTFEKQAAPIVIINVEARPEGAQGDAKLRTSKM
jgi:hypothetical protein